MGDVIFRRIRGRIVPIKLTESQKKSAKGVATGGAMIPAGTALAATSGRAYRKVVVTSADRAFRAFESMGGFSGAIKKSSSQGSLFDYAARQASQQKAFEGLRSASKLSGFATALRKGAVPLGAGLIAGGAVVAVNSLPRDKRKKINPALAAGGGAALAHILPKAMTLSKEAFTAGQGGRQEVMRFAATRFQSIAPKLKSFAGKILKTGF